MGGVCRPAECNHGGESDGWKQQERIIGLCTAVATVRNGSPRNAAAAAEPPAKGSTPSPLPTLQADATHKILFATASTAQAESGRRQAAGREAWLLRLAFIEAERAQDRLTRRWLDE